MKGYEINSRRFLIYPIFFILDGKCDHPFIQASWGNRQGSRHSSIIMFQFKLR